MSVERSLYVAQLSTRLDGIRQGVGSNTNIKSALLNTISKMDTSFSGSCTKYLSTWLWISDWPLFVSFATPVTIGTHSTPNTARWKKNQTTWVQTRDQNTDSVFSVVVLLKTRLTTYHESNRQCTTKENVKRFYKTMSLNRQQRSKDFSKSNIHRLQTKKMKDFLYAQPKERLLQDLRLLQEWVLQVERVPPYYKINLKSFPLTLNSSRIRVVIRKNLDL